jgi:hypothetical protein
VPRPFFILVIPNYILKLPQNSQIVNSHFRGRFI